MDLAKDNLLVVIISNAVECETDARDILKRWSEHDRQVRYAGLWSLAIFSTLVATPAAPIDLADFMIVVKIEVRNV